MPRSPLLRAFGQCRRGVIGECARETMWIEITLGILAAYAVIKVIGFIISCFTD